MGRREGCGYEEAEQGGGQSRGQGHVYANTLQKEAHRRWPTADLGATQSTTGMAHAQMAAALARGHGVCRRWRRGNTFVQNTRKSNLCSRKTKPARRTTYARSSLIR